ncbi:MAG: GNAT family N-acetyltransferase [Propionibacteriaceae bacterium]|nr:GNAT family N-acetyltransferase [Propionibacteriaceae bacterium]
MNDRITRLNEEHNHWLAEIDPMLGPVQVPSGERWVQVGDELAATWLASRTDPAAPYALWAADVVENLSFRAASAPTSRAFEQLLTAWLEARQPIPARLTVTIPALATQLIPGLLAHGFRPGTSFAIRLVGDEPAPAPSATTTVRPPVAADRDALLELLFELHLWELPYGATLDRPHAKELLAIYLDEALDRPEWTFVAEQQDRPVGLLTLNPPEDSEWAAPLVSVHPVCYLGFAAVSSASRTSGIGALLARHAMHRAAAAHARAVLLDHATLSPLSTPFWHRRGFRPLWTRWVREV